jgi:uncharacterized protein (DUF697 family)
LPNFQIQEETIKFSSFIFSMSSRRELADEIVQDEARACSNWGGGLFFVPGSGKIAQVAGHRKMVEKLMAFYRVEGNCKEIVGDVIDYLRDAADSGVLLFCESLKVIPVVGWLFGGVGSAAMLEEQTKDLGGAFVDILDDLYKESEQITARIDCRTIVLVTPGGVCRASQRITTLERSDGVITTGDVITALHRRYPTGR